MQSDSAMDNCVVNQTLAKCPKYVCQNLMGGGGGNYFYPSSLEVLGKCLLSASSLG